MRAPTEAGHGSIIHEGDVFEVIADNLSITEVMVLLDKAVVKGFKPCIANHFELDGGKVREFSL